MGRKERQKREVKGKKEEKKGGKKWEGEVLEGRGDKGRRRRRNRGRKEEKTNAKKKCEGKK